MRKRWLIAAIIYFAIIFIYISPFSWLSGKINNEAGAMYLSMALSGFIIFTHLHNDYENDYEDEDEVNQTEEKPYDWKKKSKLGEIK